jgi:hypothetical protein
MYRTAACVFLAAAFGLGASISVAQEEPIVPGKGGGAAHSAPKGGGETKGTESMRPAAPSKPMGEAGKPAAGAEPKNAADTVKPAEGGKAAAEKVKPAEAGEAPAEKGKPAETGKAAAEKGKSSEEGKAGAETGKAAGAASAKEAGAARAGASVQVTEVQRTKIRETIKSVHVRPVTNISFNVSVGVKVPRTIVLNPLPATIVEIVPEYRGYEFFLTASAIVIVDPETFEIVAVLPV